MVEVRDLTAPFRCNGYWFVADDRLNKLAGIFTYDPKDGCHLELHGAVWDLGDDEGPKKVVGVSSAGEKITLLNCVRVRTHLKQDTFNVIELVCEIALVGNFFPSEKLCFKRSSIRFSHLDNCNFSKYMEPKPRKNGQLTVSVKGAHKRSCSVHRVATKPGLKAYTLHQSAV